MENATQINLFKGMHPAPQAPAASNDIDFMQMLERLATNPDVDVTKMSALLDLKERMLNKEAEALFNQAFMRLSQKLPIIAKDGAVVYEDKKTGKRDEAFKFASWENVQKAIRPHLESEGFVLTFDSQPKDGGGAVITCTMLHEGGHSRSASAPLALDASGGKNNLQGMGSTLSYGKRYTAAMLLDLRWEGQDDDGKRGGMVFISDQCVDNIKKLLEETNTEEKRFLEHLQLTQLENIQVKEYTGVMNMLNAKKAKMAKLKEEGEKQ